MSVPDTERAEAESRALSVAGELNAHLPGLRARPLGDLVWLGGQRLDVAEALAARLAVAAMLDPIVEAFCRREHDHFEGDADAKLSERLASEKEA